MARIYFNDYPDKFMTIKFPPVAADLIFSVQFERRDDYKGEFGFDWMRDNYKDICNNYEELKKEYATPTISGVEYFVPWLSMFPNQEGVTLKLKSTIIEGKPKKGDILNLPAKNGIRFEPSEIKVKELVKETKGANGKKEIKGVDVTVFCDNALTEDTTIDLLDKYNDIVGKITLVKNNQDLVLKVKLVKVMGDEVNNTYNERTFRDMNVDWISKLFNNLSNECFNQALIKIEKDSTEEMTIKVDDYIEKGILDREGGMQIPRYNKGFDKILYNDYVEKNGEYNGIIFFLSAIHQKGMEAGHARPYPRDINYIMIVPSSVGGALDTYRHELGHTLGLYHSSESNDSHQESVQTKIREYENKTDEERKTKVRYNGNVYFANEYLDLKRKELVELRLLSPKFLFEDATTNNFMEKSNATKQISFWKWQWVTMIEDLKSYHGK